MSAPNTSRQLLRTYAFVALTICAACGLAGGCASYQVGAASLYRPGIRTVHVSMFRSDTMRRNLGEWLTEAVAKEIENQTPYKLVGSAEADTFLTGRVIAMSKRGLAENRNDEPRDLEVELFVEVRWIDRNGNVLMQQAALPIESSALSVVESSRFVPEAGQSRVTAEQRDVRRLAKHIVGLMEFTPL